MSESIENYLYYLEERIRNLEHALEVFIRSSELSQDLRNEVYDALNDEQ